MRIISGSYKGKKLKTLAGLATRPTSDRAKESVFNILNKYIDWQGCHVMDVFAGSGALGIEALSRGAEDCVFVEKNKDAVSVIKYNIQSLSLQNKSKFVFDYLFLKKIDEYKIDVAFIDPPYNKGLVVDALAVLSEKSILNKDAIIIVECEKDEKIDISDSFSVLDTRIYGKAKIIILQYS